MLVRERRSGWVMDSVVVDALVGNSMVLRDGRGRPSFVTIFSFCVSWFIGGDVVEGAISIDDVLSYSFVAGDDVMRLPCEMT